MRVHFLSELFPPISPRQAMHFIFFFLNLQILINDFVKCTSGMRKTKKKLQRNDRCKFFIIFTINFHREIHFRLLLLSLPVFSQNFSSSFTLNEFVGFSFILLENLLKFSCIRQLKSSVMEKF